MKNICLSFPVPPVPERTVWSALCARPTPRSKKRFLPPPVPPRPGEQEGVDYYYRTKEQFQQLIDQDEVVEHNFFNGNYYGTLKEEVNKRLNAGKLVVMVIDVHGAANIRRMYPGATTIFLLPPSTQELERRLRGRGTETEESIRERLEIARNELAQQDKFTLKLVNDEVDACAARLYDVICQRAGLTR